MSWERIDDCPPEPVQYVESEPATTVYVDDRDTYVAGGCYASDPYEDDSSGCEGGSDSYESDSSSSGCEGDTTDAPSSSSSGCEGDDTEASSGCETEGDTWDAAHRPARKRRWLRAGHENAVTFALCLLLPVLPRRLSRRARRASGSRR